MQFCMAVFSLIKLFQTLIFSRVYWNLSHRIFFFIPCTCSICYRSPSFSSIQFFISISNPHIAGITGRAGSAGMAGAEAPNTCSDPVIRVLPNFSESLFEAKPPDLRCL